MMKRPLVALVVLCVAAFATPLLGVVSDQVNVGDPTWEAGHNMVGWSDVQYGNLHDPPGVYGYVDDCRGIDCPETLGDGDCWAEITMFFGDYCPSCPKYITMRHLEGQAIDAFDLYIREEGDTPPGSLIFSYPGDPENTQLLWHTSTVEDVYVGEYQTLRFVCSSEHWSGWASYGQMYFDWILVTDCLASPVLDTSWSAIKAMFR